MTIPAAGEGFKLERVVAPKAAGVLLVMLDFVLRRSPLGPPLRRKLLNDNDLRIVRELAARIDLPPLHHPMHRRVPPSDAAADAADEAAWGAAALLRRAADESGPRRGGFFRSSSARQKVRGHRSTR